MRLPSTARAGIFAICFSVLLFAPVYYWVNSRTLIPLDIPVSLAPGHIRTGDFKINIASYFSIRIQSSHYGAPECSNPWVLRTRQLTSIGGQAISVAGLSAADGIVDGPFLGSFRGKPGHYHLDIEVLSATQEFDRCQPRLYIEASDYDFNRWNSILVGCFFLCVFSELLGLSMLFVAASTHFRRRSSEVISLRVNDNSAPSAFPSQPSLKPARSLPLLFFLGTLGTIAGLAIFIATKHWYDTRSFVVVNMPVSLAPGHIKTGDFTVRRKGSYDISIDSIEGEQTFYAGNCPAYIFIKTRWAVTQDGRIIAHRESAGSEWLPPGTPIEGSDLRSFDADPGTYSLDVQQLADGRCLDFEKPRLRVSLSRWDRISYDDLNAKLQILSFSLFSIGAVFLIAYRLALPKQQMRVLPELSSLPHQTPAWGITGLRYRQRFSARRPWAANPIRNISTISMVCALTWFVWLAPMWIIYAMGQRTIHGLFVSLLRKDYSPTPFTAGLTAPLIKIDAKEIVYLNHKETTWQELPAALNQALIGLPQRVVYFDGDPDILYMDAAKAIDIIYGATAKPILLTPKSWPPIDKSRRHVY